MRRRLTLVLVLLMAGTLLAAGIGTLLVSRQAARDDARRQLLDQATIFAREASNVRTHRVLKVVSSILRLERGRIIIITQSGTIRTRLPAALTPARLSTAELSAGHDVSGVMGGTVFAAVPAQLSAHVATYFPARTHVAVLLTRRVGALGPSLPYLLLVSGVTLALAAAVAAWLTRRVTLPLVDASAVTQRIAKGELGARVLSRSRDYPELASLGQSINAMAERLEDGRERERLLLLSVSHDLRTPLTSIRGYAEAIEEGIASDIVGAAGVIVDQSKRLERLVADLLDLARLGADRLSLHIGPADLNAAVERAVEALGPLAAAAGLVLTSSVPESRLLVAADADRLGQVITNLVENGLSFATCSVTARVSVVPPMPAAPRARAGAAGVLLLVEDDGPGISPEDLERVFDRFYQADRGAAARRGLGLGLSIVKELVQAMGGTVRAESPIAGGGIAGGAGGGGGGGGGVSSGGGGGGGGTRMIVELRPWV